MSYYRLKQLLLLSAGGVACLLYQNRIPQIETSGEPYQILPRASISDHPNLNLISKIPIKIGIVGGGISGSITAKTLIQQGYNVEVLEKNPSLGGLWFNNYDGSGLQFHHSHYNLPDFSFPADAENLPRSAQVTQYIESYVKHFDIQKNFQFNTTVKNIKKNSDETWTVNTNNGDKHYDFLILCTGPYNKPFIPPFKGIKKFKGIVMHSSEFINAESICKDKKILVVGSGKSAFDIMGQAYKYGGQVTALMRKAHWFMSPNITILGLSRGTFTASRFSGLFLDHFYDDKPNPVFYYFSDWYWSFIESYLKVGLIESLVPTSKMKHEKHFRGGARDDEVFKAVETGKIKIVKGKIDDFFEGGVIADEKVIEADVIVFATGFDREYFGMKPEEDGLWMYRNTIIPGLKNFAVVGIINTYCNPLYTNIQAIWLSEVLRGRVRLPGDFAMNEDIIKRKEYTRKIINGEATISFSWFPYPMIDQMLRDMGVSEVRKKNLYSYWFDPISPEDYKEVVTHRV